MARKGRSGATHYSVLLDRDALSDLPRGDGENDEDEGVPEDRDEKGRSLVLGVATLDPRTRPLDGVETDEGGNSEGGVEGGAAGGEVS